MAKKKPVKKKPLKKKATSKKPGKKQPGKKKAVKTKAVKTKKPASKQRVTSKPVRSLSVGQEAPWAAVVDESGNPVSLESFRGKTVVLYFYPKDDTPGCTQESCDFRDSFSRLQSEGVVVLGASKDSPASHVRFKGKYSLPFTLISDESGALCEAFGVWKEKSMYGRSYMGIERSTFVIDGEGKIAKVYPKVSVTGHVEQVIQDLHDLKG
jgi:peroxiredoxin Q/BCP